MMDHLIRTTLVVRNQFAREGLAHILRDHGFEVDQAVATPDAVDWSDRSSGHIVIFEGGPTFSADNLVQVETLLAAHPAIRIVLVIDEVDVELVRRAFTAGIYGCMPHDAPVDGIVALIQLVALGQKVLPKEMSEAMNALVGPVKATLPPDLSETYDLSARELEILKCLVAGMPNKTIARSLGVSEASVKLNVKVIFRKMAVTNRTQAAILAHERDNAFSIR